MEKKGRIDKYSKDLLMQAPYVFVNRELRSDGPLFSLSVDINGYNQFLTTAQSTIFFDDEKSAVSFLKRHRGVDLKKCDGSFRIIIRPFYSDEPI